MDTSLSPYASTTLTLFGGVAGVLLLASAVSATLKHAVAHGQPHPVIVNLTQRVNAWWVMVGAIGAAFEGAGPDFRVGNAEEAAEPPVEG